MTILYSTKVSPAFARLLTLSMALFVLLVPASAQTDNCCGIDRQCSTNDEWVSGYYAFQNNECAAPPQQQQGQPQQQQARQQRGVLPIDNCCFSGWQCDDDEEWTSGYWAFQNDHCASQAHWEEQMRKREAAAASGHLRLHGRNSNQQAEAQGGDKKRQLNSQPQNQLSSRYLEPWYWFCGGKPCAPNPNPWIRISIDLENPNRRIEETEDGTPVIVAPDLPD